MEVRSGPEARRVRAEAGQGGFGHFAAVVRPVTLSGDPVGTGLVGYEASVRALRPAVYRWTATPTRDLQGYAQTFRGEAAVVNLRDSPYGAGWSVAGLLWMDEARSRFFEVDGTRAGMVEV